MLWIIPGIIISYLVGSIPTGYIFGRVLRGIDIRKFGSGNLGATNVLRVIGKGPGIAVLIIDILKGFIPVAILGSLIASRTRLDPEQVYISLGIACIVGHNWTIFLDFKGGKGISTTLGVFIGLALNISGLNLVLGALLLTFFIVFFISKIVSLSSIVSVIFLPLYMFIFRQSLTLIFSSILILFFVLLRHKSNLIRIFKGQEAKISFK